MRMYRPVGIRALSLAIGCTVSIGATQAQSVVTIDPDGVPVINGERTFLYGTYRDPSDLWGFFGGINQAQFNLTHSYFFENFTVTNTTQRNAWISQASTYLDLAEANGVGVFLGLPRNLIIDNPDLSLLADLVNGVKDKPALYFWRLYDEPSNVTFNNPINLLKLRNAYNTIKVADPNHPVDAVDSFRLNEVDTYTDVISAELYPIRTDNITTITNDSEGLMRSVRDLAYARSQAPGSPFAATHQGHDWRVAIATSQGTLNQLNIDGSNYRPSREEIRAQAHLGITQGLGANVFYWSDSQQYDMQAEAPEIWQAFVDLGAEFAGLGDAIVSTDPAPVVTINPVLDPSREAATPSDVEILSWSRMHNGQMFLGLVNPGDWAFSDTVDVELSLPLNAFDTVALFGGDIVLSKQGGNWQLNGNASDITVLHFDGQTLLLRMVYADTLVFHLTNSAPLEGDLDGDGFVGISDLNLVLGNWNQTIPPGDLLADPSGDNFVGIEDLNTVLGHWNAGTPPTQTVPEPSALMLVLPLAIAGSVRRKGKASSS